MIRSVSSRFLTFTWLKSTWAILGGIFAGIVLGMLNKSAAMQVAPLGEIYLSFLKMCVIPIMVTAIVSSLGRLLLSKQSARYLKRMLVISSIALIVVSSVGLLVGLVGKPGDSLSPDSKATLGQVLLSAETSTVGAVEENETGFSAFLAKLIPANIFEALVEGNNMQILFFSIVFGIAVGFIPSDSGDQLLSLLEFIFKMMQKAIAWAMYLLPPGLFFIMAGQIASTGVDILLAMVKFIILIYMASLLLIAVSALVISLTLRISYFKSLGAMKQTLMIAFGTRNSIATMPSILDTLCNQFRQDPQTVKLIVPLGIVLCRYSMVLTFSLAIVFISQLYYIPLGVSGLLIALIGSIIAAVAGAGAPGVVSLSMLSLVAAPLGLPYSAAVILLLAINPIIDPIVTAANVHINCAAAIIIAKREPGVEVDADAEAVDGVEAFHNGQRAMV